MERMTECLDRVAAVLNAVAARAGEKPAAAPPPATAEQPGMPLENLSNQLLPTAPATDDPSQAGQPGAAADGPDGPQTTTAVADLAGLALPIVAASQEPAEAEDRSATVPDAPNTIELPPRAAAAATAPDFSPPGQAAAGLLPPADEVLSSAGSEEQTAEPPPAAGDSGEQFALPWPAAATAPMPFAAESSLPSAILGQLQSLLQDGGGESTRQEQIAIAREQLEEQKRTNEYLQKHSDSDVAVFGP
jgi:hypothetical protein